MKMKKLLLLFFTMLKIGLFTFGGGYAMLALLENEFVSKKKLLDHDEFMDMVAIAESTPGPIAINAATYIGYKVGKIFGSIVCTVGVCIPSFVIIYAISLFLDQFLATKWVAAAFSGVQVCVVFLILSAGLKMLKKLPHTAFNVCVTVITFSCMLAFAFFSVKFSSVFYVLISAALAVMLYAVGYLSRKGKGEKRQ